MRTAEERAKAATSAKAGDARVNAATSAKADDARAGAATSAKADDASVAQAPNLKANSVSEMAKKLQEDGPAHSGPTKKHKCIRARLDESQWMGQPKHRHKQKKHRESRHMEGSSL